MECERCQETVSAVLDREAGDGEFAEAALHLAGCSRCRSQTMDVLDLAGLGWERLAQSAHDDPHLRRAAREAVREVVREAADPGGERPAVPARATATAHGHGAPGCRPTVVRLQPVDAAECGCSATCACGCQSGAQCRCSGHAA